MRILPGQYSSRENRKYWCISHIGEEDVQTTLFFHCLLDDFFDESFVSRVTLESGNLCVLSMNYDNSKGLEPTLTSGYVVSMVLLRSGRFSGEKSRRYRCAAPELQVMSANNSSMRQQPYPHVRTT